MEKRLGVTIIIVMIFGMALSACGGATANTSDSDAKNINEGLPPVAAVLARQALAAESGANIEEITIVSHEQMTWSDSCLGLGGITESCLQTEVKGWLVELSVNGETFKTHTDWLGEQIRFEP